MASFDMLEDYYTGTEQPCQGNWSQIWYPLEIVLIRHSSQPNQIRIAAHSNNLRSSISWKLLSLNQYTSSPYHLCWDFTLFSVRTVNGTDSEWAYEVFQEPARSRKKRVEMKRKSLAGHHI